MRRVRRDEIICLLSSLREITLLLSLPSVDLYLGFPKGGGVEGEHEDDNFE